MDSIGISFRWFDLVAVALIFVGVFHGRKNGMSQELFNTLKWLVMLAVAPLLYEPLGKLLLKFVPLKALYIYVGSFVAVAAITNALLVTMRKKIKDKMSGSDVFGSAEYPLGMLAGAFQYSCLLIMLVACLNAKYIDEEELQRQEAAQREAMGERFFPTSGNLHKDALGSISGQFIRKYFKFQLITPVGQPAK